MNVLMSPNSYAYGIAFLVTALLLQSSVCFIPSGVRLNKVGSWNANIRSTEAIFATVPLRPDTDRASTIYAASTLPVDGIRYDRQSESSSQLKEDLSARDSIYQRLGLPALTPYELKMLKAGQRVQKQHRTGRQGTGWVVLEVAADHDLIFDSLTKFDKYMDVIPTVRRSTIYGGSAARNCAKVQYSLSRFRIKVNIVNTVQREEGLIHFSLDSERSSRGSGLVIKQADGFWHVHPCHDRPGYSRVWLSAALVISPLVPTSFVDYAACRALPRATNWIQPHFESLQKQRAY